MNPIYSLYCFNVNQLVEHIWLSLSQMSQFIVVHLNQLTLQTD